MYLLEREFILIICIFLLHVFTAITPMIQGDGMDMSITRERLYPVICIPYYIQQSTMPFLL